MAVINTNTKALFSQMALKTSGREQTRAMEQLSTGLRINSARDDAAGLAISTRMTQQIRSLDQAVRNAGDAISLIQTAEGATNEITDMLQRMRELAIQAINDTNENEQRSYLDLEFQQLKQEINRIAEMTEWNGFQVLNGTAGAPVGIQPVFKIEAAAELNSQINFSTSVSALSENIEQQEITFGDVEPAEQVLTFSAAGSSASYSFTLKTFGSAAGAGTIETTVSVSGGASAEEVASAAAVALNSDFAAASSQRTAIDNRDGTITLVYAEDDATPHTASAAVMLTMVSAGVTLTAASVTGAGSIYVGGVTVDVVPGTSAEDLAAAVKTALAATSAYSAYIIEDNEDGSLTITYDEADGDVELISFTADEGVQVDISRETVSADDLEVSFANGGRFLKAGSLSFDIERTPPRQDTISFSEAHSATTGYIFVGGVTVETISAGDTAIEVAAKVKSHLVAHPDFNAASGREVVDNEDGSITITYATVDGSVGLTSFSASASASITASVDTISVIQTSGYGAVNASFNVLYGDATDLRPLAMQGELDPTAGTLTFYAQSRAQIDHLDFSDNFTAGDVITLKVGEAEFEYELVAGDSDKETLAENLVEAINADDSLSALFTAGTTRTAGQVALTAVSAGTGFTARVTVALEDGSTGAVSHQTATSNRNAGENGVVISEDLTITLLGEDGGAMDLSFKGTAGTIQVARSFDYLQTLRSGDLSINGTMVNLSLPEDDSVSSVGNRAGSAIAKAAAINRLTNVTGVAAVVQPTVLSGSSMSGGAPISGTISINGYTSPVITTVRDNIRETRMVVVEAINRMTAQTGVVAIDTGEDLKGIRLEAKDGRNIEVFFNSRETDSLFASRTGLAQGLVSGTYALESRAEVPIVLGTSSTGSIARAGLSQGTFSENTTFVNTGARQSVSAMQAQVSKFEITGTPASGDVFSVTINGRTKEFTATGSSIEDIRANLISEINDDADLQDLVVATNGADLDEVFVTARVPGTEFTITGSTTSDTGFLDVSTVQANGPLAARKLNTGDLVINGVAIRGSRDADDTRSFEIASSSDRASSAIAIAAAINSHSAETGVEAEVVGAEVIGSSTITGHPGVYPETGTYSLFINGAEVEIYMQEDEHLDTRRDRVVEQINLRSYTHGVTATNNGSGVTLTSTDGRNMSVWFDADIPGLSAGSFGLDSGDAEAQVSTITLDVADGGTISAGSTASIEINGLTITSDGSTSATAASLADALKSAIDEAITAGLLTNMEVSVEDEVVTVRSTVAGTGFSIQGASASDDDTVMTIVTPTPNSIGSNEVVGIRGGNSASQDARTVYSTVRLSSPEEFTVGAGSNGFSSASNFLALGFTEGTFGGDSTVAMSPPKVGRLSFQVGAAAGQEITIDLADFSKAGNITNLITGDLDSDVKSAFISTREGAQEVLANLDVVMDKVNATRAVMGAVMNRLDHAIDNLSNASMNQAASRSQIRDADYASASTELARTQIMQQAATAVLAQANMSQQTVLQLLQG